jgi:hypothetical protein
VCTTCGCPDEGDDCNCNECRIPHTHKVKLFSVEGREKSAKRSQKKRDNAEILKAKIRELGEEPCSTLMGELRAQLLRLQGRGSASMMQMYLNKK